MPDTFAPDVQSEERLRAQLLGATAGAANPESVQNTPWDTAPPEARLNALTQTWASRATHPGYMVKQSQNRPVEDLPASQRVSAWFEEGTDLGGGGKLWLSGSDAGASQYADQYAKQYGEALDKGVPGLTKEARQEHVKEMRGHAYASVRQAVLDNYRDWLGVNSEQAFKTGGKAGAFKEAMDILPTPLKWVNPVSVAVNITSSVQSAKARKRFENNEADSGDYITLARDAAFAKATQERSLAGTIGHAAAHAPAFILSMRGPGALAAGAGEAIAGRVASTLASKGLPAWAAKGAGWAAGVGGGGLVFSAATAPHASEAGFAGVAQGQPVGEAFTKAAAAHVVTNVLFQASGAFAPPEGRNFLISVIFALGAGEAGEDLNRALKLAPKGGTIWQLAEGDPNALRDFAGKVVTFSLLEGAMHTMRDMRSKGISPERAEQKARQELIEQVAKQERTLAEDMAPPETPQSGAFAQARSAGEPQLEKSRGLTPTSPPVEPTKSKGLAPVPDRGGVLVQTPEELFASLRAQGMSESYARNLIAQLAKEGKVSRPLPPVAPEARQAPISPATDGGGVPTVGGQPYAESDVPGRPQTGVPGYMVKEVPEAPPAAPPIPSADATLADLIRHGINPVKARAHVEKMVVEGKATPFTTQQAPPTAPSVSPPSEPAPSTTPEPTVAEKRIQKMRERSGMVQAAPKPPPSTPMREATPEPEALTPIEKHVFAERERGRSLGAIVSDEKALKPDGTPYSREGLRKVEISARQKMGKEGSTAQEAAERRAGRLVASEVKGSAGLDILQGKEGETALPENLKETGLHVVRAAPKKSKRMKDKTLEERAKANGLSVEDQVQQDRVDAFAKEKGDKALEEMEYAGTMPSVLGGKSPQTGPVSMYDIIKTASDLFGVPYYVGRIAKKAAAVYKGRPEAVMVKGINAGNGPVMMHEVAHGIDKNLGIITSAKSLPPDVLQGLRQMDYQPGRTDLLVAAKEGFAEYMRMRQTDQFIPNTPQKQAAAAWIENKFAQSPETVAKLERVKAMFGRFAAQGDVAKAATFLSTTGKEATPELTTGEKVEDAAQSAIDAFREKVDDNLAVLSKMTEQAKRRGHRMPSGEEPRAVYFYLMHQSDAMADRMARKGVFTYKLDANGDMIETKIGQSLDEILSPLKPEDTAPWNGELSKFEVYAVGQHVEEEMAAGRPAVDETMRKYFAKAMTDLKKDPEFVKRAEQAANNLTKAYNATLDSLAEVGVLDRDLVAKLQEERPSYVSLARVRQDVGWKQWFSQKGEQMPSPIHVRSGSGEQIVSPVLSYLQRLRLTSYLLKEQLQRSSVREVLQGEGMGNYGIKMPVPIEQHTIGMGHLEQVFRTMGLPPDVINVLKAMLPPDALGSYFTAAKFSRSDKPNMVFMVNGKPEHWRIGSEALYDLMTNQQVDKSFLAMKFKAMAELLGPAATLARGGATTASHTFQARNIFFLRDPWQYLLNTISGKNLIKTVGDLATFYGKAYGYAARKLFGIGGGDPYAELYHEHGGRSMRNYAFGERTVGREYAEAMGRTTPTDKAARVINKGKGVLELMGAGEHGPRIAEVKNYLDNTGYTKDVLERNLKARPDESPIPLHILVGAINAAAEVTVPFKRQGVVTREANKSTPFLGAHFSGMSKELRNWKAAPQRAFAALATYVGLELLHWYTYKDEDWYKELSDYDRANYFVVKMPWGKLWYLPKVRGMANLVAAPFQEALRTQSDANPKFADTVGQAAQNALVPPLAPPALKVPFDIARNTRYTGQPIVPSADEKLPASEKFWKYQGPYAAEQFTGGLTGRLSGERSANPFGRMTEPHASIEDFYKKERELSQKIASSTFRGGKGSVSDEDRATQRRMAEVSKLLGQIRSLEIEGSQIKSKGVVQTVPRADQKRSDKLEKFRVGLARFGLGQPELASFPNPLTATDLSPEVAKLRNDFIKHLRTRLDAPEPVWKSGAKEDYTKRRTDWKAKRDDARDLLRQLSAGP